MQTRCSWRERGRAIAHVPRAESKRLQNLGAVVHEVCVNSGELRLKEFSISMLEVTLTS